MSAAVALVLTDGQATPVNHTFNPMGFDKNGVFWWQEANSTSAVGNRRVSLEVKRPDVAGQGVSSKDRVVRVKISVHYPVLETVSNSTITGIAPAPTVAYVCRSFFEEVLPERSSNADRKDLRAFNVSLIAASTVMAEAMIDMVGVW